MERDRTDATPGSLLPRRDTGSSIAYDVQISAEDYVAARRLALRPGRALRWIGWGLGVPFCVVLGIDLFLGVTRDRAHPFLPTILGAGAFLLIWYYVMLPWQVRRAYRQVSEASNAPVHGELSESGVTVHAGHLRGHVEWTAITRWKRDKHLVLLYSGVGDYTMIPLRGFAGPAERDAALALIARRVGVAES